MDTTALQAQIRELVGRMSPAGVREPGPDDRLAEDLGYDSLAVIELSLQLEQDFGLRPGDSTEPTPDVTTVADLEAFVVSRVAAAA